MLLDLKLQDIEGKELVNHLASIGRAVPFIIITGQGDERDIATHRGNRGGSADLIEWQHIAIVVAQDVVRCQGCLAYCAGLRTTVRAKVALLHRAYEATAEGWIGQ